MGLIQKGYNAQQFGAMLIKNPTIVTDTQTKITRMVLGTEEVVVTDPSVYYDYLIKNSMPNPCLLRTDIAGIGENQTWLVSYVNNATLTKSVSAIPFPNKYQLAPFGITEAAYLADTCRNAGGAKITGRVSHLDAIDKPALICNGGFILHGPYRNFDILETLPYYYKSGSGSFTGNLVSLSTLGSAVNKTLGYVSNATSSVVQNSYDVRNGATRTRTYAYNEQFTKANITAMLGANNPLYLSVYSSNSNYTGGWTIKFTFTVKE